ncbi:hypothetical protein B0H66DRAFT_66155 [Apodospora peruviana]|uniref:Uncharacterized protein n=1 Tax=Apodospora peruviana TaxID=516989 RepID=A0AAE0MFF9_9PEZI|nr:hypothetical protein B0H66DRAFT_66155 [Apodospora peruviana]
MDFQPKLINFQPVSQVALHKPIRMSNYSYSRADYPLPTRPEDEDFRGSFGSDCSMPGMVEDSGSDDSAEDDYQHRITGAELWDRFGSSNFMTQPRKGFNTQHFLTHTHAAIVVLSPDFLRLTKKVNKQTAVEEAFISCLRKGPGHYLQVQVLNNLEYQKSLPEHHTRFPTGRHAPSSTSVTAAEVVAFKAASKVGYCTSSAGHTVLAEFSESEHSWCRTYSDTGLLIIRSMLSTSFPPLNPYQTRGPIPSPAPLPSSPVQYSRTPSSHMKPLPRTPDEPRITLRRPSLANLRKLSLS